MKRFTEPIEEIDSFLNSNPIVDKDFGLTSNQSTKNNLLKLSKKQKRKNQRIANDRSFVKTLDLHDKTSIDAEILIGDFISDALKENLSCVIIVHGKGLHSEGGFAVLKDLVHRMVSRTFKNYVKSTRNINDSDGDYGAIEIFFE